MLRKAASNRRIERHDPVGKEPLRDRIGMVTSQVIPHEDQADGRIDPTRRVSQPGLPLSQRRTSFIHGNHRMLSDPLLQHRFQLGFEPGMQNRVGRGRDAFGPHLSGGWSRRGSAVSPCHSGHIHGAATQGGFLASRCFPDEASFGRDQPHPDTTAECLALQRPDTPARSAFFSLCVRIMHRHHSCFAYS